MSADSDTCKNASGVVEDRCCYMYEGACRISLDLSQLFLVVLRPELLQYYPIPRPAPSLSVINLHILNSSNTPSMAQR